MASDFAVTVPLVPQVVSSYRFRISMGCGKFWWREKVLPSKEALPRYHLQMEAKERSRVLS